MSAPLLPVLPLVLADVPLALRRALEQEGIPWTNHCQQPPAGRFLLFDSKRRACPIASTGQTTIDVDRCGRGNWGDRFAALADERSSRQKWTIAGLDVSEEIATVDKRAVRRALLDDLRRAIEALGGVWIRVAAFPAPYRAAFNFRIDHDEFDEHDFSATLRAIEGREHATTHFVCAGLHAGCRDELRQLVDLDVGSHGYWHHTYHSRRENLLNIRRGIEALQSVGIKPRGFAAPHGRFNRGLLSALAELGVTHSSEFGLAYDDLPYFPASRDVLQIPVHPVCLGIFLEAARRASPDDPRAAAQAAAAAADYLEAVVRAKCLAGEPAFLYGHPRGRLGQYPEVLRRVLDRAWTVPDAWKTTLSQFGDWWRRRAEVRLCITGDAHDFRVAVVHKPRLPIALEVFRGERSARLPLDRDELRVSTDTLVFQRRNAPILPKPQPCIPSWRTIVLRSIDWERETPTLEIPLRTWRGWVKRTLRHVRRSPSPPPRKRAG